MIKKYPRTGHCPFSEGTTSDDKILKDISFLFDTEIVMSEKLDGENQEISEYGVYARSRTAETQNPWSTWLKPIQQSIQHDLKEFDIGICGENMYGIHSIAYSGLESHFYVFGIKNFKNDTFLSWDETEYYANLFDFKIVPVLFKGKITNINILEQMVNNYMLEKSKLSNNNIWITPKEGIVIRLSSEFKYDNFYNSIAKYVRKSHIKSDEHWSKNWKRAYLSHELKNFNKEKLMEIYKKEIEKGIVCF